MNLSMPRDAASSAAGFVFVSGNELLGAYVTSIDQLGVERVRALRPM